MRPPSYSLEDKSLAELKAMVAQFIDENNHLAYQAWLGHLFSEILHDLANGLNTITSYILTLEDSLYPRQIEEREYISKIGRQVEFLRFRLRTYASLARGKTVRERVLIPNAIHEAIASLERPLSQERIHVSSRMDDDIPAFHLARVELQIVLLNLLSNALAQLRFKMQGPRSIEITASMRESDTLAVSVSDNGPGIDPVIRDKVFEAFVTTRNSTGLGLFISRRIVESWGGEITCRSSWGHGATFMFTLPRKG